MPAITYNDHPVQIVRVWPTRNVLEEPLLTVRSLKTGRKWEAWQCELKGDYNLIRQDIEKVEWHETPVQGSVDPS